MAEVWHFNECLIRVGTTTTRLDTYATDVSVSLTKDFFNIKNEDGQVLKRFESGRGADMSIGVLFDSEIDFTDGSDLRLLYANQLGTTTYQLGSSYIKDKGWSQSENEAVKHDVKIIGRNFGTV